MRTQSCLLAVASLLISTLAAPRNAAAASAYMVPFDFKQPGQFTVQVPWRLGPDARSCPLLVHGFFGYTWFFQEQLDLYVHGVEVEVDGRAVRLGDGPFTFSFEGEDARIRQAGAHQLWWYRLLELPIELFPAGKKTRLRVRLHREGKRARGFVPKVPRVYSESPDMRIDRGGSPYEGEEAGWYLFEVYRSAEPLPGHPDFVAGDTHVHTEYTHHSFEFGGPLEAYAAAAKAIGLDWATFTDHGHSFDSKENLAKYNQGSSNPPFAPKATERLEDKWDEFVRRTQSLGRLPGRPFVGIVGTEVDVIAPSADGHQYFCHALVYGHSRLIPAEGPNGIDVKLGPMTLRHGESGQSGEADVFGRDTLTLDSLLEGMRAGRFGNVYGKDRLVTYLAHPINKYDAFKPNRVHIGHWWRWGFDDDPDELPARYARSDGRLPVSGFQVFNGNSIPYAEEIDPSIPYWDSILCEGLRSRPLRRNAILGGTDTHGDLTSSAVRSSEPSLSYWKLYRKPDGDGFGSVRTLAACAGGLSEAKVLESLRDGRTVVTNGPFVMAGIDRNGDGALRLADDTLPSTRPGDEHVLRGGGDLTVTLVWNSTPEFGAIEEVRLVAGRSTGARVVYQARPDAAAGMGGTARVVIPASELPDWSYVRAECVTRRGQDVIVGGESAVSCLDHEIGHSGDDTEAGSKPRDHGRLLKRIERRAYSNPVWVKRAD